MLNLTTKRKKVYDLLKKATKPLSVQDIYDNLNDATINLSTVYRAIEYFENYNLLLKFHFSSKNYYFLNEDKNHDHYFICTSCLLIQKVPCNMKEVLSNLKLDNDFTITNHEMNVYGLCNKCH